MVDSSDYVAQFMQKAEQVQCLSEMAFCQTNKEVRIAARTLLEKVVAKLCGAATKTPDTEDYDDEVSF